MSLKGYTSKANVENYGLVTVDDAFNTQINSWIEAAELIIDDITGRNFKADAVATPRLYSGDGDRSLIIDDAVEITQVEIGLDDFGGAFQTIPSSGSSRFFTEPANHVAHNVPITKVVLRDKVFTPGMQNQRITAKWGYSVAVPKNIEFAATVFVFGIANQNRQGGQSVKSERIGNYQVTYNSDNGQDSWGDFERALAILDSYKRYHI